MRRFAQLVTPRPAALSRPLLCARLHSSSPHSSSSPLDYEAIVAQIRTPHPHNNVSAVISDKVGRNLHLQKHHPLNTIKTMVEDFCVKHAAQKGQQTFQIFDRESPVVSTQSCFDDLLVPPDHVSRSLSDTYYINDTTVSETV
jgi:phenylalanyl-tRNA synthetase alpha chain